MTAPGHNITLRTRRLRDEVARLQVNNWAREFAAAAEMASRRPRPTTRHNPRAWYGLNHGLSVATMDEEG